MFKKISASILILLTSLAFATATFAAEKDRVAILDFKAENCPKSLAKVVGDLVSTKVFETNIFIIVERDQIDQVFKELSLQQTGCTDASCAVQIGKMLSANKIIFGTVHKVDRYIVLIKIVNVEDNKVVGTYREEANEESDIESAVLGIVEKIKYDFKKELFFALSISGGYLSPMGDFGNLVDGGFGANVNIYMYNFIFKNLIFNLSSGVYLFKGKKESIESIMIIPALGYLGYSFNLFKSTKLVPYIGGGYYINMMNYDKDNADAYGNYEYKREIFYDPAASARLEFAYVAATSMHLFVAPTYTFFFEKGKSGQTLGADGGIKMFF